MSKATLSRSTNQTNGFSKNSKMKKEIESHNKCIHQLFAQQVEKTPDAVAIVFENQQLTYRELNAKANQLAHHLQAMGVGKEVLVGLCVERSIEIVIGIIGILKAGGAYVPLDPAYPQERLAFMLEDANLKVVLTKTQWLEILPVINASVICLDADWQKIEQQSQENPICDVKPENLAYLIYTSGSTGKPKGVQMPHASICNYLEAIAKIIPVNSNDIYLQTASFSFTASVRQLFLPLSQGARSVIATREQTRTPLSLFELIQNQGVTISDGVPSVWRYGMMALESLEEKYTKALSESKLRLIVFGGELLPYQLIKKLRNLFSPPPRFFNILGQTESIGNGFYSIPEDCNIEEGYVPVGHPLKDIQQVYVLNSQLEPVKIGESGELHIAGSTLARGYLNRTQANAEKFIDNPFNPQQRLFKTGDVARYSRDGNLEILGRIDFQVNIRGMRVELEEIEAVLKLHPSVREGIVSAREDIPGDQRLVAYIVAKNQALDWGEIRSFLEQKLPDYMVPNAFVLMEKLPVLPNGKLDRNSLPAPNISVDIRNFVAPRNPKEQLIANIWAEVLGLSKIGVYDNFLELGGHSLLASLVISRLREALSVELSVSVLFESPTVASLSEKIATFQEQNQPTNSLPVLQPVSRNAELPLSLTQQRFWFLDQMEGANAAYNIARALRLVGRLNFTGLQQAIESIIQRHETLRTSFGMVDGKPVQFIAETVPFTFPLVDLQALPEVERQAELERLITAEYTQPFDLNTAPLLRAKLIRLESDSHVLLVTMHHIISDAWSVGIFLKELSSFYGASPLPELPIQYADFAYWQRQWLQNDIIANQLNYWQQQLADAPPVIELPTDYPRSAIGTFRSSIQRFKLGNHLTNKLKTLSQKSGTSLFMTMQAAFVTLLSRYTGQEDIVIGSPITNRNRPALESLIGFFVNTLVLRTRLENNPTFRELLAQVRQVALDAYAHQDVPFDRLVEVLQPERHQSHSPLFQVMFVLQNSPVGKPNLPGLNVTEIELDRPTAGATFDLTLSMQEIDAELKGAFEYDANLFDAETIARMVENFQILLEAIVTNPDERVGQLPLLTAAQQQQLLVEWNNTQTDYPQNKCVHELVTEQAQKTPDAVALVFKNQQLTYQQLNQQANQLAHYLQSLGVEKEILVGVYLERSFEMIVGLLGILKAGGAYVPLDPNYPSERLNYMVADSQISVILTHSLLLPHLSSTLEQTQVKIICWDKDLEIIASQSLAEPINNVQPGNLAYVIYTSGSTGKPKGVMIEHSGLLNLVFWHLNNFEIKSSDRTTNLAGTAFDAAVWELWPYLVVGASIHLIKSEFMLSAKMLQQQLIAENITMSFIPTPLAEQLCLLSWAKNTALRIMLTGGDRLNHYPLSTLPFKLVNNYGPTENTVVTTSGQILPGESESKFPPIGRPIANTQVYILDRYLQPVPIGVSGELYLGGAGLAKGYLNRPDLTSERFIPHPFVENQRLYKTGDLARYLPDGNIEFIGRIDHLVKIRGFRIELGEIETILSQHPQVQQVVVIVREDNPGNKYLTAYVVNETGTLTSSELRQFLKEHLPEYMIPSAFVILNAFPLTPNGKIDRRALPVPNLAENRETTFVAPRNPTEEIIADIMANVLGLERVGIHDNFFDLGGHSLLATQVISRLRSAFTVELPLRCLFESPTVAKLENFINHSVENKSAEIAPPIVPVSQNITELPLSFAQARLWFLNELEGASATYNMSFAVQINGNLDVNALAAAFQEIVNRHSILRTNFQVVNGSTVQVIHPTATIPLSVVDAENLPADPAELRRLATLESQKPFDLTNDCLIRVTLWQFYPTENLLLLTLHHIVSDGWSMGILIQELSTLYQAFTQRLPSPLPELPVQYADYAVWQRNWFTSEVLATQQNYWKQQLADAPQLLKLPTDRPRPAVQTFQGASVELEINSQVAQQLKTLSQQSGATLYMTLLTAFATLLSRYSGQDDILIGSPIANRHHQATESLIGFFVNTLVMRTQLSGNPSFLELLQQVRQVTLDAYAHQDIPFEQVVEALQPERSLSYTPLFQVMFDLQQEPISWELPGLSLKSVEKEHKIAKFDLTLEVVQTAVGLRCKWEYNSDLFDQETISRMSDHFQTLLAGIIANPQQPVRQLPLLTEAEEYQLLVEWNNTQLHYPRNYCIHELFAKQVQQTPDNVAVEFAGQKLTYRELDIQANQLAHYLQSLGVGTETLVGLCVERSPLMIVGLLGILKAGGAYLPLDSSYPQERLAFMLSDSQVSVLLTQEKLVSSLPKQNLRHCICLDKDWKQIAQQSATTPISNVKAENLAYVIYTSGSTGKPKGVMIEHRSVVNFVTSAQSKYNITSRDRVLQFAPIAFDVAVEEIYPCLTTGGTVVLRTDEMLLSASRFVQRCQEWQLTVLDLPTSYWHQLILELGKTKETLPESLRLVIIGGEPALPETLKLWQTCVGRLANPPQLLNAYGPTETTVEATCCDLSEYMREHPTAACVPIGSPLNNVSTYVLDSYLQPVPIGVAGELHIGGESLARGYLGRPDVTALKFIANPFSNQPEARLYKTGDLVRYLADGKIEFLGRIDNQVKIRGFRIEIGEIEAAIAQHPQVQSTAVIVREDEPGDKRLVAYIVPQGNSPTSSELYRFLKQMLPDYMMPAVWVNLENLPLTTNGKVDYRALPVPDASLSRQGDYTPPRSELERQLVQIWSEVLNISQQIGIHDNFFELGGHSLKVTQLIFRVREVLQIELPVLRFFETPTVAEIAEAIELAHQGNHISPPPKNSSIFDLAAEATLDSAIVPESTPVLPLTPPFHSFLTGVTGFMGAFLLSELLQQTPGNIYCLIRANSVEAAERKLKDNLSSYLLWDEKNCRRIIPVVGDLSQPFLGLSASKFDELASLVDGIYHNGALVNSVLPYAQLKAANVNGTQEILRLACRQKIKPVHYISTISVFPLAIDAAETKVITEQDNPDDFATELTNGYAQSKLVADKLVRIANSRGVPISIHRLGRITGHSQTGVANTNDLLYRMIKGSIQLGSIPQRFDMVDMNPIDYVAKGIIALSLQPESLGKTFHFVNPQTISWHQLANAIRSLGYSIAEVPEQQWREEIANLSTDATDNSLYPLIAMFSEKKARKRSVTLEFNCQETFHSLEELSITYPSVDDRLLLTYFSYLMKSGFLEVPKSKILL